MPFETSSHSSSSMIFASSNWRPHANSTNKQPIFERPLGVTEQFFYWDTVFERTADTLQNAELQIRSGSAKEIFGLANITRAWSNLKQQYPLLAAQIEERDPQQVCFVVADEYWRKPQPGEISFLEIASPQEASDLADRFIVHDRLLANNLLARIFILKRTDRDDILHIFLHVSHCVTDGMANFTILRTFLDLLCSPSYSQSWDLIQRLMLSRASEDLSPQHLPVARRRWRLATATIITANRASKLNVFISRHLYNLNCANSITIGRPFTSTEDLTANPIYPCAFQIPSTFVLYGSNTSHPPQLSE